jgi:hypothetical protein
VQITKETKLKHITAFIAFAVAFITYYITVSPTVSFWDCGEFIASAFSLGIPHPPGTPFYVFFSRVVIMALPFVEEISKRVNYISVATSAATIYLASLFIWDVLIRLLNRDEKADNKSYFPLIAGSLSGSFLLTFSDTFWFNAVEAEVYGMAMFMVVLVSWLALKWTSVYNQDQGNRYLIMIAYIAFLGVGVHLYSLLTIPAIFALLLFYEKDGRFSRLASFGFLSLVLVGITVLYVVLDKILEQTLHSNLPVILLIPAIIFTLLKLDPEAKKFDKWPVWVSGIILYSVVYNVSSFIPWSILLFVILLILRKYSAKSIKPHFSLSLWLCTVALIGFSTHAYIPIRSELDPIIDENDPEINLNYEKPSDLLHLFDKENWKAFNEFIERKQYGSESMISRAFYRRARFSNQLLTFPHMGYGGYQIAQFLPWKVGEAAFVRPGKFFIDPEDNAPLVRGASNFPTQMMSIGESKGAQFALFFLFNSVLFLICFRVWQRKKSLGLYLTSLYIITSAGLLFYINFSDGMRIENREREYWVRSMEQMKDRLGPDAALLPALPDPNSLNELEFSLFKVQNKLEQAKRIKGGAIEGILAELQKENSAIQNNSDWIAWRKWQNAFRSAGYNTPTIPDPVHLEVRERDYFYAPAFIFMSLLFGIGIGLLLLSLSKHKSQLGTRLVGSIIMTLCFAIPAFSNYKEHDRSGLYVPWDYAWNLIQSCLPNSILFTNGDNDTFPLWFIQEVEGIRKDVRVVNLSLGNTNWYIHQIKENPPQKNLSFTYQEIEESLVPTFDKPKYKVAAEKAVMLWNSEVSNLELKLAALDSTREDQGTIKSNLLNEISRRRELIQLYTGFAEWAEATKSNELMKVQDKLVLDLVRNNPDSPIHYATTVSAPNMVGLDKYMVMDGMVYTLQKGDLTVRSNEVNLDRTMYLVDSVYQFRGIGDGSAYINQETERLLFNYNSIYIRLAFQARQDLVELTRTLSSLSAIESASDSSRNQEVSSSKAKLEAQINEIVENGLRYLEKGIYQFPGEWRNYVVASEICELAGKPEKAIEYLAKGVENVNSGYKRELEMRLQSLKPKTSTTKSEPNSDG